MGRLFGTDGARGVANTELTCELAMQIGRAAALVLSEDNGGRRPVVMIGMDTRASGAMLEGALTAGLCSVGADVLLLGVVPTPAVAYMVVKHGADAGIMISASHNPCEYNGIKIFASTGYKLPDAVENQIEAIVLDQAEEIPVPVGSGVGMVHRVEDAVDEYVTHVAETIDVRLDGLRLALDCANGSASVTAAKLFHRLGADVEIHSAQPDGVNINDNCGSTHIGNLQKIVREGSFDAGFAFDGDADRCLAVDNNGDLVDGDYILALMAEDMKERGLLARSGKKFSEFTGLVKPLPQTMVNVRVAADGKARMDSCEELKNAVKAAEDELGNNGRVLIRPSGTEPLIRVMTEGVDKDQIFRMADELAEVVRTYLG